MLVLEDFYESQAFCLHALPLNSNFASVPAIVARFVLWGKRCSGEFGSQLHSFVECFFRYLSQQMKKPVRLFSHQGFGTLGVVVL